MTKAVTKKDEAQTALTVPEAMADLFKQNAGAGQADSPEDIQLPFIKQVQDISPQRDITSPEYISGADSGDLFNSVTRELFKSGIEVIPANFRNTVVAFAPRSQGGGFLGEYESKEQALDHLDEPAELIESTTVALMYRPLVDLGDGTLVGDGSYQPALMSFGKTKQKVARAWRTQLLGIQVPVGENESVPAPIFGTRWVLESKRQRNNKGSFFNLSVRFLGLVNDRESAEAAQSFGEAMRERELRSGDDALAGGQDVGDGSKPAF